VHYLLKDKYNNMDKNFNLIISGVGGQGLITLVSIINEASFIEGYDVRSSELHGLAQRGGSVEVHIKFGKKVFSPMVQKGKADLIIGLELTEATRSSAFAGKQTKFLIDKNIVPYLEGAGEEKLLEMLNKFKKENLNFVEASKICKEKLQKEVLAGTYLLGNAVAKNLLPIKKESVLSAIKNVIPQMYQEINIKAFNLAW